MFFLRRPAESVIDAHLARESGLRLAYPNTIRRLTSRGLEKTRETLGPAWVIDHNRETLGSGEACFARARDALSAWTMFELGWVEIHPRATPIIEGTSVAILSHTMGLWGLSFAKILYTLDDVEEGVHRYGFGYGTLPGHLERGEERFMVGWDLETDEVFFELLAFSHPGHFLAWLGYPVTRHFQRKFARDAKVVMREAVGRV